MCETSLGRFKCRDGVMTRIKDDDTDSHLIPEQESSERYDPMAPPDESQADKARRATDSFVAASKARWAKKSK
jgi:hypothetical protein